MGFYYLNVVSVFFLAIIYSIAILLFWLIWAKGFGFAFRGPVVWIFLSVILVTPWIEEFWTAYRFGQACKDAGTFIYRKVEVDGYYDGTGIGQMTRLVGRPGYKFIESNEGDGKYRRVEYATVEEKAAALAWYAQANSGRQPNAKEWVTHQVSDRSKITVEMDTGYAWRISRLDRPTARYHYTWPQRNQLIAHKVFRHSEAVRDVQTDELVGQSIEFGRLSPWFFIALDDPGMTCPQANQKPGVLLYQLVLQPIGASGG